MMKVTKHELEKMKQESHRSILSGFRDEITVMRDENISFPVIKDWLRKQGIKTSVQNISQFYKRSKKAQTVSKRQLNPSTKIGGIFSDVQ